MTEATDLAGLAASTPSYPTLRAELGQHAVLEGRVLDPAPGQDVRECLVDALAERARHLRGPQGSIRTRIEATDDSGTVTGFSAVVTASGTVVDTTEPDEAATPRAHRRGFRLTALAAAALVLVGTAVTAAFFASSQPDHSRPGPVPRPTAGTTPTVYPRPAPAGWSSVAQWSAPIASNTRPVIAPNGLVIAATEETVQARRARTGALVWQVALPSAARITTTSGGLHISRVNGRTAVVVQAGDRLLWWPIGGRTHRRHAVPLPAGSEVSFAGSSPLVTSPGQHAGLVAGDRLVDRVVPPGATAMAVIGDTVLAADTAGHVWRLTPASPEFPPPPVTLQAPNGAHGTPHVAGVLNGLLVTIWPTDKPGQRVVALSDPRSGRPVAARTVAAEGLDTAQWYAAPNHQLAALGDVIINAAQRTIYQVPGFEPWIALNGLIYGVNEQDALVAVTAGGQRRPAGGVVPMALTRGWAIVTATVRGETTMYALPPAHADSVSAYDLTWSAGYGLACRSGPAWGQSAMGGSVSASRSFMRQLGPLMEMTSQWCSSRSRMAVARTSSPRTGPHSEKALLLERMIEPFSYRAEMSWNSRFASL